MQSNVLAWLNDTANTFPDKLAVYDENGSITFREFRRKSQAIARELLKMKEENGLVGRQPVAVYMEKGLEVLVSFMGTAYAGCFYSPIDVEMPEARVNKILEILHPQIVITTAALKSSFEKFHYKGAFLIYEQINPEVEDEALIARVEKTIIDTDLLYVLFTFP